MKRQEYLELRKEIIRFMKEKKIIDVTTQADSDFNPYLNQIENNNGIGMEFYYGYPIKLYSPWGELKMGYTSAIAGKENRLMKILKELYGLEMVEKERLTQSGQYGPVYAITKVPWRSEELPIFKRKEGRTSLDIFGINPE